MKEKDKVINLYFKGLTTGEIARELDLCEFQVVRILEKENLI